MARRFEGEGVSELDQDIRVRIPAVLRGAQAGPLVAGTGGGARQPRAKFGRLEYDDFPFWDLALGSIAGGAGHGLRARLHRLCGLLPVDGNLHGEREVGLFLAGQVGMEQAGEKTGSTVECDNLISWSLEAWPQNSSQK